MTVADTQAAPARMGRSDLGLLACCAGAGFATLLDSVVVTYAVPLLGTTLDAPTSGVQWFLSIYSLTFGLGLVPGGRLGDAHGRRTLFIVGLVVFAAGALAAAAAPGIWWAVAGRAVQGLGAGIVSAQVLGIVQDRFTGLRRVRALAAYSAAGAVAAVIGPLGAALALGVLPDRLAWRAVLALNLPFVAAVIALTIRFLPRRPPAAQRISLDLPAIVLVGAFVVLVTVPVIDPGIDGGRLWTVVGACAGLAVATVAWERRYAARGRTPLFVPELLASRGFVAGNLIALLWFGGLLAHSTVLAVYLLQGLGWSPSSSPRCWSPGRSHGSRRPRSRPASMPGSGPVPCRSRSSSRPPAQPSSPRSAPPSRAPGSSSRSSRSSCSSAVRRQCSSRRCGRSHSALRRRRTTASRPPSSN
ncbi:MFS transporter [Dactylosporangium sp. NPDC050588]|uniref:MFS transporter n=1 Tax=Dactylosporangium sp. NPDC050588 TaxID=3157211 RepID=UPI0033E2297C